MAITKRDKKIDTRTARRELKPKREPYWVIIRRGAFLGYRKNKKSGGVWIARIYGGNGKYTHETIAIADDIQDANGIDVLNFAQAQEKARAWFDKLAHNQAGTHYGPYTVQMAVDDYLAWYKINRKAYQRTKAIIDAHIIPQFGSKRVDRLTTQEIREWLEKMVTTPPRKRSKTGQKQAFHDIDNSEEAIRKRKATVNRTLNYFKAILNKAFNDGKTSSDDAWRRIKPFSKVDVARIEYLELEEVTRLVNACPPDLREIVCGALYTGCRYAELAKMQVQDFQRANMKVFVKPSKSGKPRYVTLTEEGAEFFQNVCLNKSAHDLIFTKADGMAWGRSHQQRPLKKALQSANITKDVNFHTLRHTHASQLAMRDVPLIVIAQQLGHSDTRIVEKHYAHLSNDYTTNTIRKNFPALGINQKTNVTSLF